MLVSQIVGVAVHHPLIVMPGRRTALKAIEGRFGGSTRSVFAFPLLLARINAVLALIFVGAMAVPAVVWGNAGGRVAAAAQLDASTILGGDGLAGTVLFYSGYSSRDVWGSTAWRYCACVVVFYAFSGFFTIWRLGQSNSVLYSHAGAGRAVGGSGHPFSHAVFGGWSMSLNHRSGIRSARGMLSEVGLHVHQQH